MSVTKNIIFVLVQKDLLKPEVKEEIVQRTRQELEQM